MDSQTYNHFSKDNLLNFIANIIYHIYKKDTIYMLCFAIYLINYPPKFIKIKGDFLWQKVDFIKQMRKYH